MKQTLSFASIQYLIEQEVGRIVLPQIYKNIDINIAITPLPAQRAQYAARTGSQDGEIMRIWTYGDENQTTIRVPTPYYFLETMPFVLKGRKIHIANKDDLALYRIAKVRGVKHTNNITRGMKNVYEVNSTENMFKLLMTGKVDVALTNTIDGLVELERLGFTEITTSDKPLAVLPLYHYLHESNKTLVSAVDNEIIRLKSSGELNHIIEQAERQVIGKVTQKPVWNQ